jgi:hypothetical protein
VLGRISTQLPGSLFQHLVHSCDDTLSCFGRVGGRFSGRRMAKSGLSGGRRALDPTSLDFAVELTPSRLQLGPLAESVPPFA